MSGGIGKPLVAQNRDLGGIFLSGHSDPATIALVVSAIAKANNSKVAEPGSSEGATKAKKAKHQHGATTSKDPNEGVRYPAYVCVCNTEDGSSESDRLRKMFNHWSIAKGKRYQTEEEELRFKIWCANKKMVENSLSTNGSGDSLSINYMNKFADRSVSEQNKMKGALIERDPFKGRLPPHVVKYLDTLGEEGVEKGWKEFDEWAERHKRDYGGSSEERTLRFHAYMENKRMIDLHDPGFWRYGYDLDNMDKFTWEASLVPEVAPCSRCGM